MPCAQVPADLVTFTEKILHEKLHFCAASFKIFENRPDNFAALVIRAGVNTNIIQLDLLKFNVQFK